MRNFFLRFWFVWPSVVTASNDRTWLGVPVDIFLQALGPKGLDLPVSSEIAMLSGRDILLIRNPVLKDEDIDDVIDRILQESTDPLMWMDTPTLVEDESRFAILSNGLDVCAQQEPPNPVATVFFQHPFHSILKGGAASRPTITGRSLEGTVDFCHCSYTTAPYNERHPDALRLQLECPEVHGRRTPLSADDRRRRLQWDSPTTGLTTAEGMEWRAQSFGANVSDGNSDEKEEHEDDEYFGSDDDKPADTAKKSHKDAGTGFLSPNAPGRRHVVDAAQTEEEAAAAGETTEGETTEAAAETEVEKDVAGVADMVDEAPQWLKSVYHNVRNPAGGHYAGFFGPGDARYHSAPQEERSAESTESEAGETTDSVRSLGMLDAIPGLKTMKKIMEMNEYAQKGDYAKLLMAARTLPAGLITRIGSMFFDKDTMKALEESGLLKADEKEEKAAEKKKKSKGEKAKKAAEEEKEAEEEKDKAAEKAEEE